MQHDTTLDALGWERRGMLAQQAGRHDEAMSCFERALAQSERAVSWLGMALSQIDLKRSDEAASSLRRAASLAPKSGVISHLLAMLTGQNPGRAPDGYVTWVFNGYAAGFDSHLASLGYRGPEMLAGLAARFCLPDRRHDILDLGCGTGLSGLPFRPYARRLEGIDLAPAMIEQSQRRGIYDCLHQGEIHAVLATLPDASFDLVLAADTLIYIGDIDMLTDAVARILKPGGSFLFTVETGAPGSGFRLTCTGRYSHAEDYIHAIAGDRLTVKDHADGMLRVEAGKFTEGRAWRLARPQQPAI